MDVIYTIMDKEGALKITSAEDIGRIIRLKRKDNGLTLEEAAAVCCVSYAFMSALENGKETVRLNKVLQVLQRLGIDLNATSRTWSTPGDV
jgi:transcriptional regulator with XRE-family HTH domain